MRKLILLLTCGCLVWTSANAQQWGLYTLYSVQNSSTAYLVDTNGTTYKTWSFGSSKKTGYSSYLIEGDTLVRTVSYSSAQLNGGGRTGEVQKVLWDGTVVWDYVYSSSTYCLHHDICPMPNGNVLMISWDVKSSSEATQAGSSSSSSRYSEKIIEVRPTGSTTGTIVWEWKLWDHLCQSYNSSKDNYVSSVSANPQLININYKTSEDFFHLNGLDYNEDLDQITFSAHNFNELYVIDHSTTTAQAAGHTGGNSGKGGDILYRWGNSAAYSVSGTAYFNVIHDAHWVSSDNPNYPDHICGFTNQGGTSGKSAFIIIDAPENGYTYTYTAGQTMPPTNYAYKYNSSYSSSNMGNSQQLPNGNSLMCVPSQASYIFEVSPSGTNLWSKTVSGSVAQAFRYDKCFVRGPAATAGVSDNDVCSGAAITLNSSATSVTETSPTYTYSWSSSPAGFTSSSQNPTVNPSVSATYTVTITNTAIGCSDIATVNVTVHDSPVASAGNDVTVSSGQSTTLTATGGGTYLWSTGATTAGIQISPTTSTTYSVTVTNSSGCTATDDVVVTVNQSTLSLTILATPEEVCAGEAVQLYAIASGGTSYTYSWYSDPPGFTSILPNPIVVPAQTTDYSVTVTSGSDYIISSVTVIVNALPSAPTVTFEGNSLVSSQGNSYQWYMNGNPISGATSQSYAPTEDGSYQVEITDSEGCASPLSSAYQYTATGISSPTGIFTVSIFPNPTTGIVQIEGLSAEELHYSIGIYDTCGKLFLTETDTDKLDLSSLENGVYLVGIYSEQQGLVKKKITLIR